MKNLFVISIALITSLLFVQCKKTEILPTEVIGTEKSLTDDVLNGTSWEVLSIDSDPNSVELSWSSRYPKFTFNNGIVEMTLGQNTCSKQYVNDDNKLEIITTSTCYIANHNNVSLYNLFNGAFEIRSSHSNPNELFVKSLSGTILVLRKTNTLSTAPVSTINLN